MSENKVFSDEPLPGIQEQYDNWEPASEFAPPIPAGVYNFYIAQIREEDEFTTQQGVRYMANLDFRVQGGEYDERTVTFQRVTNAEFERPKGSGNRTSNMLDMVKCAGLEAPLSNAQFSQALHSMVEQGAGRTFKAQVDWQGFCTDCYDKKLQDDTGEMNIPSAKQAATSEQKREASKVATKASNARQFPEDANGNRKDSFICDTCGAQVQARIRIRRFIPQES